MNDAALRPEDVIEKKIPINGYFAKQKPIDSNFIKAVSRTNVNLEDMIGIRLKDINFTLVRKRKEGGKPDHYNHYFGSVVLPILHYEYKYGFSKDAIYITVGNGPFDDETFDIFQKIGLKVIIFDMHKILNRIDNFDERFHIVLDGCDTYWRYDSNIHVAGLFNEIKSSLSSFFSLKFNGTVEPKKTHLTKSYVNNSTPENNIRITFIDRKENPYYALRGDTSGSSRRSIPNLDEIISLTSSKYLVNKIYLEDLKLEEKARIFNQSDIVVCQHGAALFNTVFMREGSFIIEILPDTFKAPVRNAGKVMASLNNLNYYSIAQNSPHSRVSEKHLLDLIERFVS